MSARGEVSGVYRIVVGCRWCELRRQAAWPRVPPPCPDCRGEPVSIRRAEKDGDSREDG